MADKIMECITNPVKCKLLLEIYSQGQATAKHLSDTLGDIPQATLYRNLKSCTSRNSSLETPSNTSPQSFVAKLAQRRSRTGNTAEFQAQGFRSLTCSRLKIRSRSIAHTRYMKFYWRIGNYHAVHYNGLRILRIKQIAVEGLATISPTLEIPLFYCLGFIPQNITFIRITISKTAAIATQKPILSPSHWVVPKRVIQISFQFIVTPP